MLKNVVNNAPIKVGRFELANPLALAPMCNVTDLAMRRIARNYGSAMCFTQMVSAEGLVMFNEKTWELIQAAPDDEPLGVQLFGGRPDALAKAARLICDRFGVKWIDLNMGCPVRKVACKEAGSGLLKHLPLVREIWMRMRDALPEENCTVKIRSGWDHQSIVVDQIAEMVDEIGIDAICLHPRTRTQAYSGEADWTLIARLREKCKTAAVYGSGDLLTPETVPAMLEQTGAEGAFLARGATGNPWIFSRALGLLSGSGDPGDPSREEMLEVICTHLDGLVELYGERPAVKLFRRHLTGYLKGFPGVAAMRKVVFMLQTPAEVRTHLTDFFIGEGTRRYAADPAADTYRKLDTDCADVERPAPAA